MQKIFAVETDLAFGSLPGIEFIHAVKGPQQCGLPTAGGTDERRHLVLVNGHIDVLDGLKITVVEVQVLDVELDAVGGSGSSHFEVPGGKTRSEERRVGKEGRSGWTPERQEKKDSRE